MVKTGLGGRTGLDWTGGAGWTSFTAVIGGATCASVVSKLLPRRRRNCCGVRLCLAGHRGSVV